MGAVHCPSTIASHPNTSATQECAKMECLSRYDVAQLSVSGPERMHQRTDLIDSSYTCDKRLCKGCPYAHFCDATCAMSFCANTSTRNQTDSARTISARDNVSMSTRCQLPDVPLCSYLNTTTDRWTPDGRILEHSDNHIICGYTHLTSSPLATCQNFR